MTFQRGSGHIDDYQVLDVLSLYDRTKDSDGLPITEVDGCAYKSSLIIEIRSCLNKLRETFLRDALHAINEDILSS